MSSNIQVKRICQHCGVEFLAKTTVTQYCSDRCGKRAYKQRIRDSKIQKSDQETEEKKLVPLLELKDKDVLTVKQVATLLKCSRRAVSKMIDSGRLAAMKFSERNTRVRRSDVEDLFQCQMPEVVFRVDPPQIKFKVEDCYTIAEAENLLGMSSAAVYHYIKRNKIPKFQEGRYVYVPKKMIDSLAIKKSPLSTSKS
ncbi:helix-turn-helix domain-containing protein [Pedobacter sp. SYSU D00535]|uniref:helix-turn-helix domain-containing protein n=1 Tax=Pedobacter sp. SYSU D00535 TaxID=2810308 RepID=UPI001A96F5F1|nr:helix-turn-helix domain-containing protein [Pedobacter sp. SYSU D00535]